MNNEELQAAIGQIEAGAVTYRELKKLAEQLGVELQAKTTRDEQAAILLEKLRAIRPPDKAAASSAESANGAGVDDGRSRPQPQDSDADLLMDEDMDIVEIRRRDEALPRISRRLMGRRGAEAHKIVRDVSELATQHGYVVRRRLRRIGGVDYGMRDGGDS